MSILFQCAGITGVVLLLYGTFAFAITQVSSWFFWTLIGAGAGLLLLFVVSTFLGPKRAGGGVWKDLLASRSLRHGTSAFIYTAIVAAIVIVANVMSQDFHKQKDFTESKVNTLTDQSVKLLKGLTSPVKITAFMDDRNQSKPMAQDLLEMYRFQTKNVQVEFVDPDKEKERAGARGAKDGDIVVEFGAQSNVTQTLTEEGITQAISKVTRTSTPTVCFSKGHGELDIEGADDDPQALSAIRGGMENEGYKTKAIPSLAEAIPSDCSAFVVAGPKQPFTQGEASQIQSYLDGGGKALFLLDPVTPDPRLAGKELSVLPTGLEDMLKKWGVEVGRNMILEKHLQLMRGMTLEPVVLAQAYGNHPIVDPIKGRQTVFELVRSVRRAPDAKGVVVDLVMSAGNGASWAESNVTALFREKKAQPEAGDLVGPVSFGVALEKELSKEGDESPKQAKIVVLGDSDFVSNRMVRSYEFNFDLFLNSVNWLQGEGERISIRPKRIRTSTIDLSPMQLNMIFYVAIIGIPMLVLIFGLDLWWYRRRRG